MKARCQWRDLTCGCMGCLVRWGMASDAFVFTSEQKQLLESLSRETGKSIPLLIAEARHLLCVKYGKPSLLRDTAFQITGTGTSV